MATISGTGGNDNIRGTAGEENTISGNSGDDRILGRGLDDFLLGGNGNDVLDGANGDDTLRGGGDNDDLNGGNGRDMLFGDRGNDILDGGNGNDDLTGGIGNDTFSFGGGFRAGQDSVLDFELRADEGGVTFDTLSISQNELVAVLDSTADFLTFVEEIENDGNGDTDALYSETDLAFTFADGTGITLVGVVGMSGLTTDALSEAGADPFSMS